MNKRLLLGALSVMTLVGIIGCGQPSNAVTSPTVHTNTSTSNQISNTSATSAKIGVNNTVSKISTTPQNPPFQNRLNVENTGQDANFDPVAWAGQKTITVVDANGKTVHIDLTKTPVLFEAYWCPHCQRTLELWKGHKFKKTPIIIATGYVPNTSLKQAKTLFNTEEKALDLSYKNVDFLINYQEAQQMIHSFPQLLFPQNGTVQMMVGEHTLSMWSKALNT